MDGDGTGLLSGTLAIVCVCLCDEVDGLDYATARKAQETSRTAALTDRGTQKENKERITLTADSTAAIALALHLYYNGVHDEESTKTIVQPHRTQWNNKMYGMNNLHR